MKPIPPIQSVAIVATNTNRLSRRAQSSVDTKTHTSRINPPIVGVPRVD